ncbi:Phosphate-import protein PhnD [Nocardia cerradoensis]|uniref:Phosphate-import protein PhnD n=1 Tax=Nocardia cerradoensis TaxID=85688 RepID=A0A231GZU2_9NOCA|nr:phosphate/phosphite/phosphonate ABC transporter substrate-binding protein [Nocardia cerradoensis]OXR42072.1 Phosphate-import protein PhnD [Nocardia cerradoensis]
MNRFRALLGVLLALCLGILLTSCGSQSSSTNTIKLGAIATGSAPEEQARYQKIADQLAQKTGMKVDLVTSTDYYAIAEGLRGGKLDVAFLNSLGYVLTAPKAKIQPLAVGVDNTGQPGYYSYLITKKRDEIKGPADVKGHTLAIANKLSTSGYLFPLRAMQAAGVNSQKDTTLSAGGNHAANILAVASGQVDAAFVDSVEFEAAVKKGRVNPDEVSVVWKSDRISGSPVVARSDLPADRLEKIKQAVLGLTGTAETPLGVEKTMKMGEVEDSDYDPIRALAKQAGLSVDDLEQK